MDITPTILELAGIPHPGNSFQGRKVLTVRGKSWAPDPSGKAEVVHSQLSVRGWELFGQQEIHQGAWKAIYVPSKKGKNR
ncbi:hypothetical protein FRB98_003882 [Tulasnella sp. 332]|nr:hypothetical protein FRB98_003882 [Tulasnella sp. 332]